MQADQFGLNNFRTSVLTNAPGYQFDVKIDHNFSQNQMLAARYSQLHGEYNVPFVLGSADFNDGFTSSTNVKNIGLEYNWSLTPTTLWTNRFAVDRVVAPVHTSFKTAGGQDLTLRAWDSPPSWEAQTVWTACQRSRWIRRTDGSRCTRSAAPTRTLRTRCIATRRPFRWSGAATRSSSALNKDYFSTISGSPTTRRAYFSFPESMTASVVGGTSPTEGNSFASLLLGYGAAGGSSYINILPTVADKSMETAFYVQDDWKVSSRLTINLGLRYEWSSPYTERFNHQQFSDFTGDTGVSVVLPQGVNLTPTPTELKGTTLFVNQGGLGRSVPTDRNNFAPRAGFAFSLTPTTVIRGGAGIYYGLSPATNYQYPGTAFSGTDPVLFTLDNYQTQYATLSNPFPNRAVATAGNGVRQVGHVGLRQWQ